jgi:hypothetical protein
VQRFLERLKSEDEYFDYRIWKDDEGAPLGVCWITKEMRERFLLYGSTMSLDAMKRKLNSLAWAYIAPVVQDQELRVGVVAESLLIEESFEAYAFVVNSLCEMEPARHRATIGLIFADCGLSNDFLPLVGMQTTCRVVWDSFHLLNKVWPDELGESIFAQVQEFLSNMVHAKTEAKFKEAFAAVEFRLRLNHPQALEYLKKRFYDHPERFARYTILSLPDHLDKTSSQGAESNHASVIANGEAGSNQDLVYQIQNLLERQEMLKAKHGQDDSRYYLLMRNEAESASLPEDMKEAYVILGRRGLLYFRGIQDNAQHYRLVIISRSQKRLPETH